MLVTVPTSSTNLRDLLTDAQFATAHAAVADQDGYFRTTVQNLSTYNVYVEMGLPATITGGLKVYANGGTLNIATEALEKVNLISETAAATDVRIMVG